MAVRLGIFICSCGPNIGEKLAIPDLAEFARTLPDAVEVHTHSLLCSPEGQAFLTRRIQDSPLEKIVVGGCSPREHETTFRKVLENAGLNPFQLQMANIREQCAWVTGDPDQAGQKARDLLRAAVWRVREHEPLPVREMAVNPDVLVLGGGVAGLAAALNLAGTGRRVHLVERAPFLGGKTVLYEKIFPGLECGACLVSPWIDRVIHHEGIAVYLLSEMVQIRGYRGNFEITLRRRTRGIDPERCLGCGACGEACPVRVKNEHLLGLAERPAVYLPFPGAQPACSVLDRDHCLYHRDGSCRACSEACPMGAIMLDGEDQSQYLAVGAVVLATGFERRGDEASGIPSEPGNRFWLSGLEMEVLLNSGGPTGGRIVLPDGRQPGRVGIFSDWFPSRGDDSILAAHPLQGAYLKMARQIREQLPQAAVVFFFREMNLPDGEAKRIYRALSRTDGVRFVRLEAGKSAAAVNTGEQWRVTWTDSRGTLRTEEFDLLIIAENTCGSKELLGPARQLRLPLDEYGFVKTLTGQWDPVATFAEGIYAVGCARGPRDIQGAILDGQAAAGRVGSELIPGQSLVLEPVIARVTEAACSGCRICLETCPFLALEWEAEAGKARINEALCRGCGLCAVICPAGAIQAFHYEKRQISAEIRGLLHGGTN